MRRQIGRCALAALFMAGGCLFIAGTILVMNMHGSFEKKKSSGSGMVVAMTPRQAEKPKRKKLAQQPKPMQQQARRAAAPNIGSALTGKAFGIDDLVGAADLLGAGGSGLVQQAAVKDVVRGMVMTEQTVDVPPRPIERKAPEYPSKAREEGIEGKVTLGILIGSGGEVQSVKIQDSTPPGVFEDAAVSAIKQWVFEPALYQGKPVKVWASQTVKFNLS